MRIGVSLTSRVPDLARAARFYDATPQRTPLRWEKMPIPIAAENKLPRYV
jgi:hypothetical protein